VLEKIKNTSTIVIILNFLVVFSLNKTSIAGTSGTEKWRVEIPFGVLSSPAIGEDGTIYVGSLDGLYAFSPNGTKIWNFATGDEVRSSITIGDDGTIYIGCYDKNLYAINPNGTEKWRFKTEGIIYSSPAIGKFGTIYAESGDENLYAINPNGIEIWRFSARDSLRYSPAIGKDGTIYFGGRNLYAINRDGTEKWRFDLFADAGGSPAIGDDGTIYIASDYNNYLYAIHPNGTEKWKFKTYASVQSSVSIDKNGTLYVESHDGYFYAVNPNGTEKWKIRGGATLDCSPAIGSDSIIYRGGDAINPNGTLKWYSQKADTNPALGDDGTIYIGHGRWLVAIYGDSDGLADSSWPMFHHDNKHTGRVEQDNYEPTAEAGPDQTAYKGDTITLDGSNSSDPDDGIAFFSWRQIAGPVITLSSSSNSQPSFIAPVVTESVSIIFELTVTDYSGSTNTDTCTVNVIPTINPPSNSTAKATSSTQIVLGWKDNSNNESGFNIERKTGNCGSANPWMLISTKNANTTTYTDSGLFPNTTYSYRILAFNTYVNSSYCTCSSATTGLTGTPNSPTNLTATSVSSKQVNLKWKDNSTDERGFRIYRRIGQSAWTLLKTTDANVISYSDLTATDNSSKTSYQYYVRAYNSFGSSPTTYTAIVPYNPTNLKASPGSGTITISWTDNSTNETGFQIYKKSGLCSTTSTWTLIASVGMNKTSWKNTNLVGGTDYSYQVRAFYKSATPNTYGYSMYSNCSSATAP
jgi:outer membrane protein assembly factor BamB